ncbi:unnamed protein product, partial [Hapterophycus canaliculatus]
LKAGLKVKGKVADVKDFGVFIQINNSDVRGMCHRTEAADHKIKHLPSAYEVGDLVKAVVLKVQRTKRRLSLGLKPSYFKDDGDSSDEDEDAGSAASESYEDDDEDGDEVDTSDEEADAIVAAASLSAMDEDGEDESQDDAEEEDSEDEKDEGSSPSAKRARAGHRSRKKAKERREEEERIAARERALQDEDASPETAGDYERLLVATPNDSLLWVKFMAFKLSLADVE